MASPSEHSDHPSTLPPPELNPLQNPLLAQNMGRWAEVYFRNPPENRERAVLELLQELEAEAAARGGHSRDGVSTLPAAPAQEQDAPRGEQSGEDRSPTQVIWCESCGSESPNDQRFCGNCGAPLSNGAAAVQVAGRDEPPLFSPSQNTDVAEEDFRDDSWWSSVVGSIHANGDEARRQSYRVYGLAAVLVAALALGYMAWRGWQANQAAQPASLRQPAVTVQPKASSPAPVARKVETPESTAVKKVAPPAETTTPRNNERPANLSAPVAEQPAKPALSAANGSEELALALNYLEGSGGHEKSSAEAVEWLWKSVEKRNTSATLLLADLYLRGSGVPKNCDQARVLLDAAASRGSRDAAVRLRNMQAFGCNQ